MGHSGTYFQLLLILYLQNFLRQTVYWPLKDGFWSICKSYRTVILWWVDQKNIIEFAAIFVCLLLSWSRWYLMKWSSNSDSRIFNNSWPLHLNFSNVINLCPNIWFIKNSKCQQSFFEKRSRQKKTRISHTLKDRYFVMGGHIDMNLSVFWEISVGFLKSIALQLFPEI